MFIEVLIFHFLLFNYYIFSVYNFYDVFFFSIFAVFVAAPDRNSFNISLLVLNLNV